MAEPIECEKDGTKIEYRSLLGFHDRRALFDFYMSMQGDSYDLTYDWFVKVWQMHYPSLRTSSERPCTSCIYYDQRIHEFNQLGDHASAVMESKRKFSGTHTSSNNSNNYLIYNEPNTETSNVNCFHFDKILSNWLRLRTCKKATIASDTASKLRCNLFLALIDYRVRILRVIDEVWWMMFDSGHHEHDGDAAHAKIQRKWTSRLRYDYSVAEFI